MLADVWSYLLHVIRIHIIYFRGIILLCIILLNMIPPSQDEPLRCLCFFKITLETPTQNIDNLPREEQMVNIEDDADDNQTVDDDDEEHSNEDIWPVLHSLVHYFGNHGAKKVEMLN